MRGKFGDKLKKDRFILESNASSCSTTFKLGKYYLVFASKDVYGRIDTIMCAPNKELSSEEEAKEMIKVVKKALRQKPS